MSMNLRDAKIHSKIVEAKPQIFFWGLISFFLLHFCILCIYTLCLCILHFFLEIGISYFIIDFHAIEYYIKLRS